MKVFEVPANPANHKLPRAAHGWGCSCGTRKRFAMQDKFRTRRVGTEADAVEHLHRGGAGLLGMAQRWRTAPLVLVCVSSWEIGSAQQWWAEPIPSSGLVKGKSISAAGLA